MSLGVQSTGSIGGKLCATSWPGLTQYAREITVPDADEQQVDIAARLRYALSIRAE